MLYKNISKTVLPIFGLHKYQVLMFVHKNLLRNSEHRFPFVQHQTSYNTRNASNLGVPRFRLEVTKQRIDSNGANIYNKLPSDLKSIQSLPRFKSSCKEHLCSLMETLL